MVVHAEVVLDDLLQVDPAPAHHAVPCNIGTAFDDLGQFGLRFGRELGRRARRLVVDETIRAFLVETMHPVAQRLSVHGADPQRPGSLASSMGGINARSKLH